MTEDTSGAIEAVYRALGFRVPIEGIDDSLQRCQVMSCDLKAVRTLMLAHKTADFPLRLWLCAGHADAVMGPKPVAVRAFCPDAHLDSIPMEHRARMKESLMGQIHAYCLEQLAQPVGDVKWEWTWIDQDFDGPDGKVHIRGTELMGIQAVERIQLDLPTPH